MERRLMLAGDVAPAVVSLPAASDTPAASELTAAPIDASSAEHLVLVDSSIAHDSTWLSAVPEGADLVVLLDSQDPLAQIDTILQHRTGLKSVHLFCHGQDGVLQLGNVQVTQQVLQERVEQIGNWGKAFADGGDLLLYGCNVAEGQRGADFLRQLAHLTGLDVAASSDRTGSTTTGNGNWELEWHYGEIDHSQLIAVEALNRYQGHLAIDLTALNMNGSASIADNELQLTGTGMRQAGTAFFDSPIAVDSSTSFQSTFSFRIGGGSGSDGADGFAFLMQNSPAGRDALGRAGGYLGYDNITRSVAIEFDTYRNGFDSAANSIAVVINGNVGNALVETPAGFDLNNGTQYYAWVDYNGDSNLLEVYLSDSTGKPAIASLTTQIELDQVVGNTAFAGFSAGNYDLPNYHRVSSWSFSTDTPQVSPTVLIQASLPDAAEGTPATAGEFTVSRTGSTNGALTVNYTIAGSAVTADYVESLSGSVIIPDGAASTSLTITPVDDTTSEPAETVALTISADSNYTVGAQSAATVTIADNDTSSVAGDTTDDGTGTVTAQSENGSNEGKNKAFDNNTSTKWLDFADANPSTRASWLQYQYADGKTYVVTSYTITSANDYPERDPANWSLLGSNDGVNFTMLDTRGNESFPGRFQTRTFSFSNTTPYNFYRLDIASVADPLSANSVQLAELELIGVLDGSPILPTLSIQASLPSAVEGTPPTAGQFTISRAGSTSGALTVNYTIAGSAATADYAESLSGSVIIPDGAASTSLTITPVDDTASEPTETVVLTISADSNYTIGAQSAAIVSIADDDSGLLPRYPSFASATGMNLNGSASIAGDELQLTGTGARQAGTAFFGSPIAIDSTTSFQSAFSFQIGGGSGSDGADGMTFLLQNSPAGIDALGRVGGYLGYDTITRSVAIEFDTYQNDGDAAVNTIAVVIDGDTRRAVAETSAGFDLNNGTQYYAWVDYNGDSDVLEVYLSDSSEKPALASLTTQIELDLIVGSSAFAGFSAGSYDLPNYHRVSSWNFSTDAPPPNPGTFSLVTTQITTIEGQGAITLEVQRIGGSDGVASFAYETEGDSAIAGQDFVDQSGQLSFADGETSKKFTIQIVDDDEDESTEQFNVHYHGVIGAEELDHQSTLVTILDDDSGLPNYLSFGSEFGLNFNGSASISNNELQLTGTGAQQAGTVFYDSPIAVDGSTSFQSAFSFRIGGGSGTAGADGMTFLLQNSPAGVDALGNAGGNLGYDTITRSLTIEFDTYLNDGDLAANSIAVVIDGDTQNAVTEAPALFELNNDTQYFAWVDYNGDSDMLAVYLSESSEKPFFALLKTNVDLNQIVGSQAYVGFSAGTYGLPNYHLVSSWTLSLDAPPADPPVNTSGDIVEQDIYTGFDQPLAVDWSPDGRNIYIAEKAGVLKVARDGATTPTVLLDISAQVNNVQDRGLLDFALHPDFQNNGYIYLLYTYDPPEVFDNVGDVNAEPDGRGNRAGRLMRVTADASTGFTTILAGSETILLGANSTWDNFNGFVDSTDDFNEPQAGYDPTTGFLTDFIASDSRSHTVGSLAFGNDGNLFVSIGDGASFNQADTRALRVQDVDSLSGKVLRIDPITGQGLSDNPFYDNDPDSNRSKVYQLGLRNPWRLTVDQQTGQLLIGETGWSSYEEINTGGPGANFGWPFYEGAQGVNSPTPGYSEFSEAQAFYQSNNAIPGEIALQHQAGPDTVVLGDIVYNGDLGFQYEGDVFYNDLYRGIVRHANIDQDGRLFGISIFTTGAEFVVDIQQGPDGSLYYVNLVEGTVGMWQVV